MGKSRYVVVDDLDALKDVLTTQESNVTNTLVGEAGPELAPIELVETGDLIEASKGETVIKVIAPGQGTSGKYGADMLRAHAQRAFPRGTHMYWNHPTVTEASERPERDLRDLAAVTVGDAYYDSNGPRGEGVYTRAKVTEGYRKSLGELAPHIGVSIRASGRIDKTTGMVESIDKAHSIDFVTRAGAGGEVVQLFEAARAATTQAQEGDMELTEALARNETLTTQLAEASALGTFAAAERDTARAENERLKEAAALRTVKEAASQKLGELMAMSPFELSQKSQARILSETLRDPAAREDDSKLVEALAKHSQAEIDVLLEYGVLDAGGTVTGMGGPAYGASNVDLAKLEESNVKAFINIGLTEDQAKIAAKGR